MNRRTAVKLVSVMMQDIEIIKEIDGEAKHVYRFKLFDLDVVFTYFHREVKPSGKRKWKVDSYWDNYRKRDSTMMQPPLPEAVREEVLDKVQSMLRVKTWDEYKISK